MADAPDRSLPETIARATNLREGAAGVEALIRAVHRAGEIRLADAARAARLPLPIATAIRRELEKAGVLQRQAGLVLTRDGRAYAEEVLGLAVSHDATCRACAGRGVVIDGPLAVALERLAGHVANGPPVDVTLDQAPSTPETAILRAGLMLRAGAIEGRRILILGDDDSVSLAIGLVAQAVAGRPLARRITVLELDPERRAFIERVAAAEGLDIEVIAHDLREVLPEGMAGAFDVFETDPPYTLEGAELFLTRAVEALDRGRGDGFFSFAHWPPRRMLDLQSAMIELGLAIKAVHPAFNVYQGAAVLGGEGQFLELAATGARRWAPEDWCGPLYTAEVAPRERAYRCTRCRKTFHLGEGGVPATIERLKAAGCPACGNRRFARAG
jgi:predicted methyltransferase